MTATRKPRAPKAVADDPTNLATANSQAVGERPRAKKSKTSDKFQIMGADRPVNGFLFIGDPHVWSRKPGRRRDANFLDTILNKIRVAAYEAKARNLWPVILGDLIHQADDASLVMISRLMETLQCFDRVPFTMVGNHDLIETTLTEGTVLHILAQAGVIDAMTNNAPHAIVMVNDDQGNTSRVLLGGTPYGMDIPLSLAPWVQSAGAMDHQALQDALNVERAVWLTHDDLAFDSSYPNSVPLRAITGVDIGVNGHMHKAQKPVPTGRTVWHNPGNINRLTIDLIDQIPRVWAWTPWDKTTTAAADGTPVIGLTPIDLPHIPGAEILSLEGTLSASAPALGVAEPEEPEDDKQAVSRFVEMVQTDTHTVRTDDGTFLKEILNEELTGQKIPDNVAKIVQGLLKRALSV
jgi:hypothetical protein